MVLAGDGPLLEPTKEQVKTMGLAGKVIFAGFRKDIKNLYKGSDIYINASQHEALSFLIIEAMAAGCPLSLPTWGATGTSCHPMPTAANWWCTTTRIPWPRP